MYAIFEAKGKQWRAEEGATLRLPSLEAEPGDEVTFDRVLLGQRSDDEEVLVGRPVLRDAAVTVEVVRHGKDDKIIVFKRKRRKGYRRKQGHRQPFTEVRIVEVDLEDATAPVDAAPEPKEPETAPPAGEPETPPADETPDEPGAEAPGEEAAIEATGAAEELAAEHGIDLADVEGTGKDGRILKGDVEAAIEQRDEEE